MKLNDIVGKYVRVTLLGHGQFRDYVKENVLETDEFGLFFVYDPTQVPFPKFTQENVDNGEITIDLL